MCALFNNATATDTDTNNATNYTTPHYDYFVLVPEKQKQVSDVTEMALKTWGMDMKGTSRHQYMWPFYRSNEEC